MKNTTIFLPILIAILFFISKPLPICCQEVREPAIIRVACIDLTLTQFGNSDKTDRTKMCVGDRLMKWNDTELKSDDDLVLNWNAAKAGEVTKVTVERNFGTKTEPQLEVIVVNLTHVGASTIFKVCLSGGRTEYRKPEQIHPKLEALQPTAFQTQTEQALGSEAKNAIGRMSAAYGRFTDQVKGHYRNDQVNYLLNRPFKAEAWGRQLTDQLIEAKSLQEKVAMLWQSADPRSRALPNVSPVEEGETAVETLLRRLKQIDESYAEAFDPLTDSERKILIKWSHGFRPLWRGDDEWDSFEAGFQLIKKTNHQELMKAIALSGALAGEIRPGGPLFEKLKLELKSLKSSDHVSIGTAEDDTHLISTPLTIDPGGSDTYKFVADAANEFRSRVIIDFDGNDAYKASQLGIAAGVMCTSMLIDVTGNDRYEVDQKGIGFALMGLGVLIDEAGNDRYLGNVFSQGVACVGVGLVMDRAGNDRYDAGSYSQAVGLPGGCGTIWDSAGDDVYLCTGKQSSPYGDANEFAGWGQGCGFGFRYLGCGGIGLMIDELGNDVYRAGQFGLGCGYFFGVGMVNDRAGNDWYECSRYGLATAAHYGVGIVLDDQGHDSYSAIRSACVAVIGSSWDLSLAVLVDGAGDDVYRGVSYAMGGAAQTSYGFLWDKSGNDIYASNNSSAGPVLGYIGGSSYGAGRLADNLAVFLDSSGDDIYQAPGRTNQQTGAQAKYGVWIDK